MTSTGFDRRKGLLQRSLSVDYSKIQIAKVKSTADSTHNGKLLVWLVNSNTNEALQENWISVMYASPFAGSTDIDQVNRQAYQSFEGTQKSYGIYAVPPDANNYVLVAFANGDETQGYWFACIYKDTLTHMVPGLASNKSYNGQTGPVAEMNVYSNQPGNPQINPTRPVYTPLFNGLKLQGLDNDNLRGAGSSSVWRDKTPTVQGWLTPGGNQFILDDKTGNQLIRIRTKSGAQILVSETDGHIYFISRDGKSWIELNNDGNIDMYSAVSINLHSDQNVNISAGQNVNIAAGNTMNLQSMTNELSIRSGSVLHLFGGSEINTITPTGSGVQAVPPAIPQPGRVPSHEPFNRQGS